MNKLKFVLALLLCLAAPARATVNFPATLDDNTTLFSLANGDVYIAQHHNNPKDAILALEAKVGVDSSAVTTSLDYLVKSSGSVDPGHKHTGTTVTFADGSVGTPGLRFGSPTVTDTNTGLFHPGTGAIAFAASGTEVARIVQTGIGIGTNGANGFPLEVAGGHARFQGNFGIQFGGTGAGDAEVTLRRTATRLLALDGQLRIISGNAADLGLIFIPFVGQTANSVSIFLATADAQPGVAIDATGKLQFGAGGASVVDTNLYRGEANTLKTDDSFSVGVNTTALVNGANDNVALPVGEYIRITGPSAGFSITGIVAPAAGGKRVTLRSTVSQTLTITNEATSTAANQITTLTGANIVCTASEQAAVTLIYDAVATKWIVVSVINCATV
jgi:hypothetical protein